MVHKVAGSSQCADLDGQYWQGCLLECELIPVAMLLTFRSQVKAHWYNVRLHAEHIPEGKKNSPLSISMYLGQWDVSLDPI